MQLLMKQIALSLLVIASSGAYVWEQPAKAPASDITDTTAPAGIAEDTTANSPNQSPAPAAPAAAPAMSSPVIDERRVRFEPPATPPITIDSEIAATVDALVAERPASIDSFVSDQTRTITVKAAPAAIDSAAYTPIAKPKLKPGHRQAPARLIKTSMKSTAAAKRVGFADGTYTGPVTDAYYGPIQIQALIQGGRLAALRVLRYPSDRRTSIRINRQALPMLRDEAIMAQSANVDIISGATLTSRAFIQSLGGALRQASS
jgi:uncharacterized protein with FMN-binding domain